MHGRVTVLAGGVGAARFLRGLLGLRGLVGLRGLPGAVPAGSVTAVVNVGDDAVLHGLMVSPDLDTVTYTLAGAINPETGWGLTDETWQAMTELRRHAEANGISALDAVGNDAAGWFSLGDRDLGTHLYRTSRRLAGATLSQVTAEIARRWELELTLLPVTDDELRTRVVTTDGRDLSFQEYFVREQHAVPVSSVHFDNAELTAAAPGVLDAIAGAEAVCIAPSNPVVSIGPLLAVPGVRDAVEAARERTVAVSPIVGGEALKGPAARLLRELGHEASVVGIARWYAGLAGTLVIDHVDAHLAADVEAEGVRCVVTDTIMRDPATAAALARTCLEATAT